MSDLDKMGIWRKKSQITTSHHTINPPKLKLEKYN